MSGTAQGDEAGSSSRVRRNPSVTFVEPPPPCSQPSQSARLRYSQLFKSMAGGSFISGGGVSEADINRHAFDSSAQPAKPALRKGSWTVLQEQSATAGGSAAEFGQLQTGAEQPQQTHGGAALRSALGAMLIPRSCPPALPPTAAVPGLGSNVPAGFSDAAAVTNPLAVSELPVVASVRTGTGTANASTMPGCSSSPVMPTLPPLAAAEHGGSPHLSFTSSQGARTVSDDDVALIRGAGSHMHGAEEAVAWHKPLPGSGSPVSSSSQGMTHVTVQLAPSNAGLAGVKAQGEAAPADVQPENDQDQFHGDESWKHISTGVAAAAAAEAAAAAQGIDDDNASSGVIIPPGSNEPLPPFWSQLTFRAVLVGLLVGFGFVLLNMRIALVTGIVPNLQVVLAGSCWVLLRAYTSVLGRDMLCIPSLAAQEVAVAASAALAVASSAAAGGFGTILLAMHGQIVQRVGSNIPGNLPSLVWSFGYWKIVAYLIMVALSGALLVLPFRRMLFARPSMTFATGAAAGQLLNTLHTPAMSYHGHKQMNRFAQWSVISFVFSGYQWVFNNPSCNGFLQFPTFGLQAMQYTWNFDFQLPFVGLGILAPVSVTWSLLVGGVISWGVLWPVLSSKQGAWFPADLPDYDIRGVFGYHLTVAMALLLSDAAYHLVKGSYDAVLARKASCMSKEPAVSGSGSSAADTAAVLQAEAAAEAEAAAPARGTLAAMAKRRRKKARGNWRQEALRILESDTLSDASSLQFSMAAMERALRQHIFMADEFISWIGIICFVVLTVAAVFTLPVLLNWSKAESVGGAVVSPEAAGSSLKMYHVIMAGVLAAIAAVANARGAGVTDINMADMYAKLGVLIFVAWAGPGVASTGAGLACGGLLLGVATTAANAMYAWRAGFMTMSSPTAVFVSHMIGLGVGCVLSPAAWLLFNYQLLTGVAGSSLTANDGFFPSPAASTFRTIAALASGGLSVLPAHAVWFALSALVIGVSLNALREALPMAMRGIVPIPAAVGVVCLSGASVAVDLAVGAAARIFWRLRYPRSADAYALVVGCALIAGEGLWGLGRALLSAFGIQAPICMTFSMAPPA